MHNSSTAHPQAGAISAQAGPLFPRFPPVGVPVGRWGSHVTTLASATAPLGKRAALLGAQPDDQRSGEDQTSHRDGNR